MKSLALAALLCALPAAAQDRVDERQPAAPDGAVMVDAGAGSVKVVAWDRAEVAVTGRLGGGADRVRLRSDARKTRIEVEPILHDHLAHADLEVSVPAGSQVSVESFQGRVQISGVRGGVRVQTVNGSVSVDASADSVHVESVNGGVSVRGPSRRIHAESVNGPVTVSDAGPDVHAGAVNGPVTVRGGRGLQRARLESVNGPVAFSGELAAKATLDVETVSGGVELALAGAGADFNVSTFSGRIVNELGPPARPAGKEGRPGRELAFSTGGGGARVTVRTLSGSVKLRGDGAARRPRRD